MNAEPSRLHSKVTPDFDEENSNVDWEDRLRSFGPLSITSPGAWVSTVKWTDADRGPTLPARSVAVAMTACAPSEITTETVSDQCPALSAVAVPAGCSSTRTLTVANGSAVPLALGDWPLVIAPSVGRSTTGAGGAVTFTVKLTGLDCVMLSLSARSMAMPVTWCVPSASTGARKVQLPSLSACGAVPAMTPSIWIRTEAKGSTVPRMYGWIELVNAPSAGPRIMGGGGGVVLTLKHTGSESRLVGLVPYVALARTA